MSQPWLAPCVLGGSMEAPPGTQVCEFCERSDLVGCPRCFYISKGWETLAYLWNRHEKNALQALNFMHRALFRSSSLDCRLANLTAVSRTGHPALCQVERATPDLHVRQDPRMTRTSASAAAGWHAGQRARTPLLSILGPTSCTPDKTLGKSTPIVRLLSAVAHHSLTVHAFMVYTVRHRDWV